MVVVKNKLFAPSSYTPAVFAAVVLHVLVGLVFWFQWPADEPQLPQPVPKHIVATVVQEENRAAAERKVQEIQKQQAERKRQQQLADQKRKAQEYAARKKREAEALKEKQAEQAAREKAAKEKAAQAQRAKEQKAREQKAQEQKAKEAAEQARQKKLAEEKADAERKKQQQAELERQLKEEQQMLERMAAEQAEQEIREREAAERLAKEREEAVISYTAQLRDKIERSWQYPPGVEPDQQVTVRINLVPTGEVIAVTVVKGSGNSALDRSVEQAVMKASPLPVPKDIKVFESNFRTFTINFRPENATW